MVEHSDERGLTEIKDLAEGISTQVKAGNRTWLTTITVSVLLLLPVQRSGDGIGPAMVDLPLNLGQVPESIFYPFGFAILTVLVTALAAAHASTLRAHVLAARLVDFLESNETSGNYVRPRDLLDIIRVSSLTRVAPLAQLIRGQYQFADRDDACPQWLRVASTGYYVALKLMATTVLFLLPVLALWYAYWKAAATPIHGLWLGALAAAGLVAAASLVIVAVADGWYVGRVVKRLWNGSGVAAA